MQRRKAERAHEVLRRYWKRVRGSGLAELLPEKPGWLEQQEYEERTSVGFHLERLTKRMGEGAAD